MLYPVNRGSLWTKTNVVDLQPPPIKKKPGRSKNKMNKEASEQVRHESQLKRENFGIKCSRCHKNGHNKATCKLPLPVTQPAQGYSIPASQPTPSTPASQPTPYAFAS